MAWRKARRPSAFSQNFHGFYVFFRASGGKVLQNPQPAAGAEKFQQFGKDSTLQATSKAMKCPFSWPPLGFRKVKKLGDTTQVLELPCCQILIQLGPHSFDRIEVSTVGWEIDADQTCFFVFLLAAGGTSRCHATASTS